jgi:Fe-S cluster assembly protein SufB
MSTATQELLANREYKYGFTTNIETETIPKGLSEDVVRLISSKKNEPEWLLDFRLKAPLAGNETAGQLGEFRLSEH